MTLRNILADYVLPLVAVVVLALLRQLVAALRKSSLAKGRESVLAALETYAEGAVADTEAGFVRAMKDPSKPGTWDEIAKMQAKEMAISRARSMGSGLLEQLRDDGSNVNQLIGSMVERAILKLKVGAS